MIKKILLSVFICLLLVATVSAYSSVYNDVDYIFPLSLDVIYEGDLSDCSIYDGTTRVDDTGVMGEKGKVWERYGCYNWYGFCKCAFRGIEYSEGTFNNDGNPNSEKGGGTTEYKEAKCTPQYTLVCSKNGVTYADDCVMREAGDELDHVGKCDPNDKVVTQLGWWARLWAWIKSVFGF